MNELGKRLEELWPMLPSSLPWELHEILLNLHMRMRYLESAPTPAPQQSETPSSVATERRAETSDGWRTSSTRSYRVSPDGWSQRSVLEDISDWLSLLLPRGDEQEVEIGVTLTSKAATPPGGSRSPSTREPILEGNGPAGDSVDSLLPRGREWEAQFAPTSQIPPSKATSRSASSDWQDFYSPDMGFYVCRDTGGDSPSFPCFYVADKGDAWNLQQLLNRAVLSDLPLEVS